MKKLFLLAAMAFCFAYGVNAQKVESYQSTQARALDAEANAYVKPLIANPDVDTNATYKDENGQMHSERGRIRDKWQITSEMVNGFHGSDCQSKAAILQWVSSLDTYNVPNTIRSTRRALFKRNLFKEQG